MIVKRNGQYYVYSKSTKDGKHRKLGGPYKTRKAAERRLRQVEWFKRKGK